MALETGMMFALASMLSWGMADFLAKKAIGEAGYVRSLLVVQVAALLSIAAYVLAITPLPVISLGLVLITAATALFDMLGNIFFFKGIQKGKVSIVSPIASSWAVVTVILSAYLFSERLSAAGYLGIAAILAGIFMVSTKLGEFAKNIRSAMSNGIFEALMGMAAYGVTYALMKYVVDMAGPLMATLFLRMAMLLFLLLFLRTGMLRMGRGALDRAAFLTLAVSGVLYMTGTLAYGFGVATEFVSLVSTVSAIYPAVTIVLAYFFLRERVAGSQKLGILSILAGLMLVSLV